jgi:hypothetical protein
MTLSSEMSLVEDSRVCRWRETGESGPLCADCGDRTVGYSV